MPSKAFHTLTDDVLASVHAIEALIAKHDWAVIHRAPAPGQPARSYTVGLAGKQLPELVVFGLSQEEALDVLNRIAERLRAGEGIADKARLEEVLPYRTVLVRELTLAAAGSQMGAARMFAKNKPWRALQVFWPDAEGRFPGEKDCGRDCALAQPRLGTRSTPGVFAKK